MGAWRGRELRGGKCEVHDAADKQLYGWCYLVLLRPKPPSARCRTEPRRLDGCSHCGFEKSFLEACCVCICSTEAPTIGSFLQCIQNPGNKQLVLPRLEGESCLPVDFELNHVLNHSRLSGQLGQIPCCCQASHQYDKRY